MIIDRGKNILSDIQADFWKGISTVINLYILNYVIERQLNRKREKYIIWLDLGFCRP